MNFRIICFSSVKNIMSILIGIELNLQIALGTMAILTIQEQKISFHFFVSSSISFIHVLQFSEYRTFTSLVKFILRYCNIFDAILNKIFFFTLNSDISLLVYKLTTDFHILILYPVTLLEVFISSNSFCVETLGFSIQSIVSSANTDSFTSSLPTGYPYFFFLPDCCGQDFQYYVKQKQ